MIFDSISSLANDIQIDKKKCGEIYTQCCIEFQKRVRKQKVRRRCSVSFLAVLLIVGMCVIMTNINHTVVYATGQEGRVQLKEGVKVQLQEEKTPLGRGYSFEISLGNGQRYKVIEGEENQNAQNIFQRKFKLVKQTSQRCKSVCIREKDIKISGWFWKETKVENMLN